MRSVLERHQHRRDAGIPTLTVLVGPRGRAVGEWGQWLREKQWVGCKVVEGGASATLRAWVEALEAGPGLESSAVEYLGEAAGLGRGVLAARWRGRTVHEREVLLGELLPAAPPVEATRACEALLRREVSRPALETVLEGCGGDPIRALTALHAMVAGRGAPALLLVATGTDAAQSAARVAARLCLAEPSWVAALAVDPEGLEGLRQGPPSQVQALVREGVVELESPSAEALGRRLEALGIQPMKELKPTLEKLAREGAPEEVVELLGEAVRARQRARAPEARPEEGDRARSVEERLLFKCLESNPATQGLFEQNPVTDFPGEVRQWEVDLLCRRLRIAVELDGHFHFLGPDRYRRDRRKDWELQRHGYLILRFLADDVLSQLEEILDTIEEAITLRRGGLGGEAPRREDAGHAGD